MKKDGSNAQALMKVIKDAYVGLMVLLKKNKKKQSGYCYIAVILNNHMDGHRPLTQYAQPMDP